jgi:hypothetical protein
MEKEEKQKVPLLSLRELVNKFPERFPINYRTLDEDKMDTASAKPTVLSRYAQCSAYKSKGYFLFVHHFPISKPEVNHE